jgi:uncharacterized protein YciU (UPF0263 family)
MTVIMQQTMPEGMTLEILDDITREMGVENDPPAGLLVHAHFEEEGRIRVVDLWDSQEAFQEFQQSRLMPASEKVAANRGMGLPDPGQVQASVLPVHGLVRGR